MSGGLDYKPFAKKDGEAYRKQFYRKFHLTGEVEWRRDNNASRTKMVNTTAGLTYKLTDFLKLSGEYRYSFRDASRPNVPRLRVGAKLQIKKDRTEIEYQPRLQRELTPPSLDRTVLRNAVSVSYNFPHFKPEPHLGAEAFTALHYTGNRLIAIRYELGTKLDLGKKTGRTLDLAVRYDREVNLPDPAYRWIFVIAFEQELE